MSRFHFEPLFHVVDPAHWCYAQSFCYEQMMEKNTIKYLLFVGVSGDSVWHLIPFKHCVHIHLHIACTLTMCYVLITMISVFLFFCHDIDYLCLSCVTVVVCACARGRSCTCAWYVSFCPSVCVVLLRFVLLPPLPPCSPTTRVPGGECRQWGCTGGRGHPRDQCDRRERRANAQRRLHAAAPWRPRPARLRPVGRRLRGQLGRPWSWLRHAGSGGQEAEVCEANGGEWGFWVGLHREEPVLRSCPSFPLPHSRGNLGNRVLGTWSEQLHDDFPLYLFALGSTILSSPNCTIPLIRLSNVTHSFTLSFVAEASARRSPAEIPQIKLII